MTKSAVARNLKTRQELERSKVRAKGVDNGPARYMPTSRRVQGNEILAAAEECATLLEEVLTEDEAVFVREGTVQPRAVVKEMTDQGKVAQAQLQDAMQIMRGERLGKRVLRCERSEKVALTGMADRAKLLSSRLGSLIQRSTQLHERPTTQRPRRPEDYPQPGAGEAISSPSFSLGDSDDSSDEEDGSPGKKNKGPDLKVDIPPKSIDPNSPRSPTENHSRTLTLEEGEVFRKGAALNAVDVEDDTNEEVTGEELRKEILETEVERTPRPTPVEDDPDSQPPPRPDSRPLVEETS